MNSLMLIVIKLKFQFMTHDFSLRLSKGVFVHLYLVFAGVKCSMEKSEIERKRLKVFALTFFLKSIFSIF